MSLPLPASTISYESVSVLFTAASVWVAALIQNLANAVENGAAQVMSDRSKPSRTDGFFGRASRTLANNMESALMFLPPMLFLLLSGHTSPATNTTAVAYIAARSVFMLCYWLNVPGVRSIAWSAGMVCCAMLMVRMVAVMCGT